MPLFSLHLYQSLLIGCWYGGCCCISSILFLNLHYFCISNLKFHHSYLLLHFAFLLSFLFCVLNFNYSLSYTGFHTSCLVFPLPLSSQNHFSLLYTFHEIFFLSFYFLSYSNSTNINHCSLVIDIAVVVFFLQFGSNFFS